MANRLKALASLKADLNAAHVLGASLTNLVFFTLSSDLRYLLLSKRFCAAGMPLPCAGLSARADRSTTPLDFRACVINLTSVMN
jgi:hypothetical protein